MLRQPPTFYDLPTPTPWPTAEATLGIDISGDQADDFSEQIGMQAVQLWNYGNSSGLLTDVQVAILLIIVIVGIGIILKAIHDL